MFLCAEDDIIQQHFDDDVNGGESGKGDGESMRPKTPFKTGTRAAFFNTVGIDDSKLGLLLQNTNHGKGDSSTGNSNPSFYLTLFTGDRAVDPESGGEKRVG